jgi:hypothetical protein
MNLYLLLRYPCERFVVPKLLELPIIQAVTQPSPHCNTACCPGERQHVVPWLNWDREDRKALVSPWR